ncbi:MAG TPA: hypothetical protein VNY05_29665 [Candidatus Acidoferrales bacterium]|nr:hypothetical protein [Candidatus Acidoferrales bacterium]
MFWSLEPSCKENSQWLGLHFADEAGVDIAAAQVGEAADEAEDTAEGVGPLPGRGKGGDTARTGACNGAVVGVGRKLVLLAHFGQNLFDQEARVTVAQAIVLVAAIVAGDLVGRIGGPHSGVDEDPNGHRHGGLLDEVVEDDRRAPGPGLADEAGAVLEDHHACRLGGIVLRGNVDPVAARGAGKILEWSQVYFVTLPLGTPGCG